jgi:hypothetical protein
MSEQQQNAVTTLGSNISEATEKDYNDFWAEDGISLTADTITYTGNAFAETMCFGADTVSLDLYGDYGEDHISFDFDMTTSNNPNRFKYSEERILKELTDYISSTYNQHYSAGDDAVQTLDLIEACGDGESFCRSNILKYASRYDKKGTARRDIMKILHYAVLLMHFNDKNAKRETYPQ